MKSKILLILLSVAFVIPVMAGTSVPNTSKEPCTGRVVWVSDPVKKISVKAKGAESSTSFVVNAETKVTLNGEAKTLAEIAKGLNAVVTPKADDPGTAAAIALTEASAGKKTTEKKEDPQ